MTSSTYETNKVSILIPVFNRELLLDECIRSAINQTYGNFEVIVVDNASTDNTWTVCEYWAAKDKRVRIFRNEENLGPVRNWLRCIEEAKGEYCKILFSDDKLMPNCIEVMVNTLKASKAEVVISAVLIGETEETSTVFYNQKNFQRFNQLEYIDQVIVGCLPVSPGAVMMRTSAARENLHLDFPSKIKRRYAAHGAGPDLMLILESIADRHAVALENPLSFFRAHQGSFSIGNMRSEVVDSYRSVIALCLQTNYGKTYRDYYIALEWVRQCKIKRTWISLSSFSKQYEGNGGILETFSLLRLALKFVMLKLLKLDQPMLTQHH